MELYLIRHGQSHVNLPGWDTLPNMDAGLTDLGHQQSQALHDWMVKKELSADVLYASTLRRASETAEYVSKALQLDTVYDDRLRELANVYASGTAIPDDKLPRAYDGPTPDKAPFARRVSTMADSESVMHMRVRLGQFIYDLTTRHEGQQTVYLVVHSGVFMTVFDNIFNTGPHRFCRAITNNTGWSHFAYIPEKEREPWVLKAHNRIDHLVAADLA